MEENEPTTRPRAERLHLRRLRGRAYSSRQARRREDLGAPPSAPLDRARLRAELRDTAQALLVERDLRDRFVSVLAHDLGGPLSVMRLAAVMLGDDVERLGAHRDLPARLLRNVTSADRMLRDLLDVLRLKAGHGFPLALAEFDFAELARGTVDELNALYNKRFILRCAAAARGVWSADALQRALWNLGVNAVKYGAGGPIVVAVERTGAGVEVRVHNLGPAIPAGAREALFQPFTRHVTDGPGAPAGWGLGLTMVKSCAEAHGGTVDVESAAEVGTTFTLKLPLDARPFQTLAYAATG